MLVCREVTGIAPTTRPYAPSCLLLSANEWCLELLLFEASIQILFMMVEQATDYDSNALTCSVFCALVCDCYYLCYLICSVYLYP